MTLDEGETWRIQRARVALLLHMPPSQVDDMPLHDIDDVLAIHNAQLEIEAWQSKRRSK